MSQRSLIWTVIALHMLAAGALAWVLNIWADEASTLYATDGSLRFVLQKAVFYEWQPPLYHLLVAGWRTIDKSIFFARCFSILCTSLTILVIHATAKEFRIQHPLFPATLFACHPFAMFLATEIRLYGFATLLSALLLWTFARGYGFSSGSYRTWPHTWLSIAGLYTNVLLGIPLIGQTCCVAILRASALKQFVTRMLCVACAYIPILWLQVMVAERTEMPIRENSLKNLVTFVLGTLQYMVLPIPREETTTLVRGALLLFLMTLCATVIYRNRHRLSELHRLIAIYLVVMAVVLPSIIYFQQLARGERYTYILFVPAIIAWSMLLDLISQPRLRQSCVCLSLLLCAISLALVYQPLAKTGDWIRVARHLESSSHTSHPILAFPAEVETLLRYYYTGDRQVMPIPAPQRFDRFLKSDFRIPGRDALAERLNPTLSQVAGFTLVTFDPGIFGNESPDPLNFAALESFLAEDFREVERTQFLDSTVRVYERISH